MPKFVFGVIWFCLGIDTGIILPKINDVFVPTKINYFGVFVLQAKGRLSFGNGTFISNSPINTIDQVRETERVLLDDVKTRLGGIEWENLTLLNWQPITRR